MREVLEWEPPCVTPLKSLSVKSLDLRRRRHFSAAAPSHRPFVLLPGRQECRRGSLLDRS